MLDKRRAKITPSEEFSSPSDVLKADELTRSEKIDVLHRWEYDARELDVATEENMPATNPSDLLDQILKALNELGAGSVNENTSFTKH
mgnify:FL=1